MFRLKASSEALFSDEIKQRLINIEGKVDVLLSELAGYKGSPHQRYGHITYSQHGEDIVFVSLFERMGIESPTYLDIGANHPIDCNNTMLLHARGAHGVNVDANPDVIDLFSRHRPRDTNVAVGAAGAPGEMTFYRFDAHNGRNSFSKDAVDRTLATHPHMGIQDQIIVPVMTLDQIIDVYCDGTCPDLLSIDAEGFDVEILRSASFRSRPKILFVETLDGIGDNEAAIDALATEHGFRKCIQMFANAIYIDRDVKL